MRSIWPAITVGSLAIAAFGAACSAKAKPSPLGGECFLATDCEPGLVCLEQPDKKKICDNDLSSVQRFLDAGRDARSGDAQVGDGGNVDGATIDSGSPVVDSGSPAVDSGTPQNDAAASGDAPSE